MKAAFPLITLCAAACLALPAVISAEPAATDQAVQKAEPPARPATRPGMLTREQMEKQHAIMSEHRTRMEGLRDAMMQKQMELDYLSGNPNVKPDDIKSIIADIVKLHKESREASRKLRASLREAGLPLFLQRRPHGPRHAAGSMPGPHFGPQGLAYSPEGGPGWDRYRDGVSHPSDFKGEWGMPCGPEFAPDACLRRGAPCGQGGCRAGWSSEQGGFALSPHDMGD